MAIQMNIAEAKAKLSALIEAAERGEEVIIARNGVPVARLDGFNRATYRKPGILRDVYGWTGPAPKIEAFAPDPADAEWTEKSIFPERRPGRK
ncbi:MAG: type II toxin-antitoxin system Phd/YefM family antitoxin [Pseudomonadota bacterium]